MLTLVGPRALTESETHASRARALAIMRRRNADPWEVVQAEAMYPDITWGPNGASDRDVARLYAVYLDALFAAATPIFGAVSPDTRFIWAESPPQGAAP